MPNFIKILSAFLFFELLNADTWTDRQKGVARLTLEFLWLLVANTPTTQILSPNDNYFILLLFLIQAYKKWVEKHGEEPGLPGINLTHDQLFFLNYAQIWCGSMRPEDALTKIRSSVHSPGPIRVLGPLSNSWDFAAAFSCPSGSPMNPQHKCSVW